MTSSRPFTWIASAIFALIAIAHIYRIVTGCEIMVGSHPVPMWISYAGAAIAAILSWMLCREARGRSTS